MNTTEPDALAQLREPDSRDGAFLHALIAACPPLDENSVYCNLLQCTHFTGTSVVAEKAGRLVGAISGYRLPERPDTLFIWQVAVGADARGEGLASRMLAHIVERPANRDVTHMETTITDDNGASWALFERFARDRQAPLEHRVLFDRDTHFAGQHASENLLRIGPFAGAAARAHHSPEHSTPDMTARGHHA
ncbi:MAG: diaminobutyrate acetyltransferase [Halioglobus sp.]|nr:diaminobutyrate acetyltransferase [Halioglobus sp.]